MDDNNLPNLSAEEQRVLGSLIEKSRTTPDYYPMTVNSLTAACNQKTSRNPIVHYDEELIIATIDSLKRKGLVSTATGGSSRVTKYKHNLAIQFPLVPAELAVICLLLLRGAQTPGEINTNSGRLYEFDTLEDVNAVLSKLSDPQMPFVRLLEKRPGQKEARYIHLLGEVSEEQIGPAPSEYTKSALEERVALLEEQLQLLREEFDKLMNEMR